MTQKQKRLAPGEVEITWTNGQLQHIQTDGMATNGAALVLDVNGSRLVVPLTSIKMFRVLSVDNAIKAGR